MKSAYFHYNKRLKSLARAMRNDPTRAENRLWYELLSDKQFFGVRFYRQRPIGDYIADFFSKELKLVIEVDGITHHSEEGFDRDEMKDAGLRELGYSILRFDDDEVLHDLNSVYDFLEEWLEIHFPHILNREK